jgi:hypothetical protein
MKDLARRMLKRTRWIPGRSRWIPGTKDVEVASEGKYPTLSWHLEKQVDIVRHDHELGQCRSSQDGMV